MARDSWRFGAGARNGDPNAGSPADTGPVDIAAVHRDDALIDAIISDGPVATDTDDEYQIAALLASWRDELVAPPLPAGPELDEIVAAVNQEIGAVRARQAAGGRLRLVRPIFGAAAAIALVVGGMTAFSYSAEPGDPLWKVKQVVFSEEADSTVANIDTTQNLQEAEKLLAAGDVVQAKSKLEQASGRASDVKDEAKRNELIEWWNRLMTSASKTPAAPTPGSTAPSTPDTTAPVTVAPTEPNTTAPTKPGTTAPVTSAPNPALVPTQPDTTKPEAPVTSAPVTTPPSPVTTPPPPPTRPEPTVKPTAAPQTPVTTVQKPVSTTIPSITLPAPR